MESLGDSTYYLLVAYVLIAILVVYIIQIIYVDYSIKIDKFYFAFPL